MSYKLQINIFTNINEKLLKIICKRVYIVYNLVGITQKNLSSNPSQGIGLNPNLNIED